MKRCVPVLAALGLLVAGCAQQVDGAATAPERTSTTPAASSESQSTPTLVDTFRIGGSVTLAPGKSQVVGKFGGSLNWTECQGSPEYPDLVYGAAVKILDSQGRLAGEHILGTGLFDEGTGQCVMRFGVQAKGGSQTYRVLIGIRPAFDVSYAVASTLGAHATIG